MVRLGGIKLNNLILKTQEYRSGSEDWLKSCCFISDKDFVFSQILSLMRQRDLVTKKPLPGQ